MSDLTCLYEFLATVSRPAAARTLQQLTVAPATLLANPRIGERLEEFEPRDVRRILVGHYEIRYEIASFTLYQLLFVGGDLPTSFSSPCLSTALDGVNF